MVRASICVSFADWSCKARTPASLQKMTSFYDCSWQVNSLSHIISHSPWLTFQLALTQPEVAELMDWELSLACPDLASSNNYLCRVVLQI